MQHDINTEVRKALRDLGGRLAMIMRDQWTPRTGLLQARLLALETALHLAAAATRGVLEMVPDERKDTVIGVIEERSRELVTSTVEARPAELQELRALDA